MCTVHRLSKLLCQIQRKPTLCPPILSQSLTLQGTNFTLKCTVLFRLRYQNHLAKTVLQSCSQPHTTHHHNLFTALFPGPPGLAGARRELLDFMAQGKINRGRHGDHPAGRHSIRTNQCPPPPFTHFLQAGCPSCHPTNSVKALKATSATKLLSNV